MTIEQFWNKYYDKPFVFWDNSDGVFAMATGALKTLSYDSIYGEFTYIDDTGEKWKHGCPLSKIKNVALKFEQEILEQMEQTK